MVSLFLSRVSRKFNGEKDSVFQQMMLEQLDIYIQKNKVPCNPLPSHTIYRINMDFPCGSDSKESACNEGDLGSIPGSRRCPGEGNGNPPQYSYSDNPMDRGAWRGTVHGVTKELGMTQWLTHTQTKDLNVTTKTIKLLK